MKMRLPGCLWQEGTFRFDSNDSFYETKETVAFRFVSFRFVSKRLRFVANPFRFVSCSPKFASSRFEFVSSRFESSDLPRWLKMTPLSPGPRASGPGLSVLWRCVVSPGAWAWASACQGQGPRLDARRGDGPRAQGPGQGHQIRSHCA